MCVDGAFQDGFIANYRRDILPIIQRLGRYQWLANVQSMSAFTSNIFDFSDPDPRNLADRQNYFSYFRAPDNKTIPSPGQPQQQLFKDTTATGDKFPMMPLNSGSNSVSNETIVKFLSLNETQYFLLGQWAAGKFVNNDPTAYPVDSKDEAGIGNCVGLPMCPGIEVTWSVQNKNIYSAPYVIGHHKGKDGYNADGLTPSRDECHAGSNGCEPGDLTKRMACPWQADFFQCTIQHINFTDPAFNKDELTTITEVEGIDTWKNSGKEYRFIEESTTTPVNQPLPPTYYSYWWPPQSPWDVLTGELTMEGQAVSHLSTGQQMNYARGINSFVQMVEHWAALAFIRDNNAGDAGFPYFTETERTNELFSFKNVGVGTVSGNGDDNETTIPVFYVEQDIQKIRVKGQQEKKGKKGSKAHKLVDFLEKRAFKAIKVADGGLGLPRSGTRSRR